MIFYLQYLLQLMKIKQTVTIFCYYLYFEDNLIFVNFSKFKEKFSFNKNLNLLKSIACKLIKVISIFQFKQ